MSRAILKEGVLRKPIANATPDGMYAAQDVLLVGLRSLTAARIVAAAPKISMNWPVCGGRDPSPAPRSISSEDQCHDITHGAVAQGSTIQN